jgi:hypothetical protein
MFGWLRKNKPKQISSERMSEEMTRIMSTYIALLNAHPHHVLDESWLPADKNGMIEVFKILWLGANVQNLKEMREVTEDYWCRLSLFQLGVGGVPISFDISKDNPTVKEWHERKERVEKWLKLATAEREKYGSDIEHFAKSASGRA